MSPDPVSRAVYDDSVRRLQRLLAEVCTRAAKAERELEQVTSWWRHEREVAGNQGVRANEAEARLADVAKLCRDPALMVSDALAHLRYGQIRAALGEPSTRDHLDAMTRDAEDDGRYDAIDGTARETEGM